MRIFLHKLMVDITRQSREIVTPGVDFEWDSGNSRIWQVFRAYEYLFGRRAEIRFEGSSWVRDGKGYRTFGTWENVFVFAEGVVRTLFKGIVPKFKIVHLPVYAFAGTTAIQSPFRFAIAFDAVSEGTPSFTTAAVTWTHVCTGSNLILLGLITPVGNPGDNYGSTTYNSVTMTSSGGTQYFTNIWPRGVFLTAPSTGSHSVTTTVTGSQYTAYDGVASYSGAAQVTPDQYINTSATAVSITATVTTSTANCWMFMGAGAGNQTSTAGTNATQRHAGSWGAGDPGIYDSNGNITTGSFSMNIGSTPGMSQNMWAIAYKFQQVTAGTINSGFFNFAMR